MATPVGTAIASGLRELASGIDALYLSGSGELPNLLRSDLEGWRSEAEAARRGLPIDWLEETFVVQPHGWGKYRYRLDHEFGVLGFATGFRLPAVRVQPRAEHLHSAGPLAVLEWWSDLLDAVLGRVYLGVSRLDLFSDWQGWDLSEDDGPSFLCRSKRRALEMHGESFSGFMFGLRRSDSVSARIYDKTREIQLHGGDYWFDVWGDKYSTGDRVLRVEFELARGALREFEIDSGRRAINEAPRLYASAAENWLTLREPTRDSTKSRWPVAVDWQQIQQASFRGSTLSLERVRAATQSADLRTYLPGATGYLSSIGSILGTQGIVDTLAALPQLLVDYGVTSKTSFEERILRKRLARP